MDDRKPYIYKTTDFGATWTKINGNIPTGHPLDYVLSMSGNPNRKGMLFAGTGRAFYYSLDDGGTWTRFKDGLPPAPVSWITVEPRFHDVVDLDLRPRPLHPAEHHAARADRQPAPPPPATTKLYEPAPIFRQARSVFQQANRPHFQLALATAPPAPVKMEILDAAGKVLRTQMVVGARRAERHRLGSAARCAEAGRADDDAARQPAHLGRSAVQGRADPPRSRTGASRRRPASRWRRRASTRSASRSTARRITQPFEVMKDPAVATSVEDLQISTRDADAHPRRHHADLRDGQPDGGLAEADRGSDQGQRRRSRRS